MHPPQAFTQARSPTSTMESWPMGITRQCLCFSVLGLCNCVLLLSQSSTGDAEHRELGTACLDWCSFTCGSSVSVPWKKTLYSAGSLCGREKAGWSWTSDNLNRMEDTESWIQSIGISYNNHLRQRTSSRVFRSLPTAFVPLCIAENGRGGHSVSKGSEDPQTPAIVSRRHP